jgi:hypothetical protein
LRHSYCAARGSDISDAMASLDQFIIQSSSSMMLLLLLLLLLQAVKSTCIA